MQDMRDHGHEAFQKMNLSVVQETFKEYENLAWRDFIGVVFSIIVNQNSQYAGLLKPPLEYSDDEFKRGVAAIYKYLLEKKFEENKHKITPEHTKFLEFYNHHIKALKRFLQEAE